MTIDWAGYQPYRTGSTKPPKALSRKEARRVYEHCMASRPQRREMLARLLGSSGIALAASDSGIQELNDWFLQHLEPDPDRPGRLGGEWYSVCHDIGLFLGDTMIERHPKLHWEFFVWGKTSNAFQRHVIMGFSTEDPKRHTNLDIDGSVATYGHRVVESRGSVPTYGTVTVRGVELDVNAVAARHRARAVETDAFHRWLQTAARRA
ncbi:hypothetical protein [Luteimicrobium album]|uniref:hypothetical protein n=1 Tax=Luteimicrobium album TaxID=1054550 RepID=UPI0024E107DA|nr:hypothetical protein [Luteimicrobium album]